MTNNELRKLKRAKLAELVIEQMEQNEAQKQELEQTIAELENTKAELEASNAELENTKAELEASNAELEAKKVRIENAGSIAEAAVLISGLLEAAQSAADIYLANVRDTEETCNKMRESAEAEARKTIEEATKSAALKEAEAKVSAEKYWADVSERLENFYNEHNYLRDLLNIGTSNTTT